MADENRCDSTDNCGDNSDERGCGGGKQFTYMEWTLNVKEWLLNHIHIVLKQHLTSRTPLTLQVMSLLRLLVNLAL